MTTQWWHVDHERLRPEQRRIFDAGHQYGATWGISYGRRQRDAELQPLIDALVSQATDTDARDEWIARRIRALQLEHEAMAKTTQVVVHTLDYVDKRRAEWAGNAARTLVEDAVPTPAQCRASWDAA